MGLECVDQLRGNREASLLSRRPPEARLEGSDSGIEE